MINGGLFSAFPSWLVWLSIIATLIILAAISVASLSPVNSGGDPGSADKTMHVFAYALAILPLATVSSRPRLGIALGVLIWSGAIELLQTLRIMGYKIALASNGFSPFIDSLRARLGIDYAFGRLGYVDV